MKNKTTNTISVVGRVAIPGTALNRRPPNSPATILIFNHPHLVICINLFVPDRLRLDRDLGEQN